MGRPSIMFVNITPLAMSLDSSPKMFRFKTSTFVIFARLVLLEFASGCRSLSVSVHPRKIVLVFVTVALGLGVLANHPRWTFLNASMRKI